jgi:hypothetical protein
MSTTSLHTDREDVSVPSWFAAHAEPYRSGYRAGRSLEGGYRLNMDAMRYEPADLLPEAELAAWMEGFRVGYLERRAAGEPLRY